MYKHHRTCWAFEVACVDSPAAGRQSLLSVSQAPQAGSFDAVVWFCKSQKTFITEQKLRTIKAVGKKEADLRFCSSLRASSSPCWVLQRRSSHSSLWACSAASCSAFCCSRAATRFSNSNLTIQNQYKALNEDAGAGREDKTRRKWRELKSKAILTFPRVRLQFYRTPPHELTALSWPAPALSPPELLYVAPAQPSVPPHPSAGLRCTR